MKMKLFFYISSLILLTCFSACKRPAYPPVMQQAAELMNTRPDSALHILEGMADSLAMLSDEAQMYYHLLTIQAKDKQYITHTDDSLINRIVEFYEDEGNDDRLMLAYFYQGSTYRDMNDAPRALKAFQQALDLNVPNYDLQAKAYNQMGTLFMYQGLHDEVIRVNRKAIELYLSQGKRNKISYAQRDIARMYDVKNVPDSALHYYQEACRTALEDGDSVRYYGILGELGGYYCETGEQEKAKQLLRLIESLPSVPNKIHIYSMLGELYENINQLDSAGYYYAKNLGQKNTRDIYYSYKGLYEIEKSKGNYKQAQEYLDKALILKDSLDNATQTEEIAKINALYNYQHIEEENLKLKLTEEHSKNIILALLSVVLILFILFLLLFLRHRSIKEQHRINKYKLESLKGKEQNPNALDENQRRIDELESWLQNDTRGKDIPDTQMLHVQLQHLKLRNQEIQLSMEQQKLAIQTLKQTDVYKLFRRASINEDAKVSEKHWVELQAEIRKVYPNFVLHLKELSPKVSDVELKICLLTKLGMPQSHIANVLGYTRGGISLACERFYKKIFGTKYTAKEFAHFIEEI